MLGFKEVVRIDGSEGGGGYFTAAFAEVALDFEVEGLSRPTGARDQSLRNGRRGGDEIGIEDFPQIEMHRHGALDAVVEDGFFRPAEGGVEDGEALAEVVQIGIELAGAGAGEEARGFRLRGEQAVVASGLGDGDGCLGVSGETQQVVIPIILTDVNGRFLVLDGGDDVLETARHRPAGEYPASAPPR